MSFSSTSVPTGLVQSSIAVGPLVGLSEETRVVCTRMLQPQGAFPPHFGNSEPSLHSLDGGQTLLQEIWWNIPALAEMSWRSSFIMEFLHTSVELLWVSRRNSTALWPWASSQRGCGSFPAPAGGCQGGRWCYHTCQPWNAGSFEWAIMTLPRQVWTPWLLEWALSGKLIFPSSLATSTPCHSPRKFLFSAKSESPKKPDTILNLDFHEGWERLSVTCPMAPWGSFSDQERKKKTTPKKEPDCLLFPLATQWLLLNRHLMQ